MHLVFIYNIQIVEEPPLPLLTLVVTPTMTTIPDTTPPGTVVAILQGVWNNGATFTGGYIFVAPNFDNGGRYVIVGNELQVSSMGVGDQGGLADLVTLEAFQ